MRERERFNTMKINPYLASKRNKSKRHIKIYYNKKLPMHFNFIPWLRDNTHLTNYALRLEFPVLSPTCMILALFA